MVLTGSAFRHIERELPAVSKQIRRAIEEPMRHIANNDWQGITGVAATRRGMPNARDVLLLHDLHWRGQGQKLVRLIEQLQTVFTVRSMVPVPPGLRCVTYRGR